jgi:hypothetical protein
MRKILVALALLTSLSGCGYSLAGRGSFLPASIKVIGVPLFTNNSNIPELERRVTDKVRAEFAGRGKYRVEPVRTGADAVLSGVITSVTLSPAATNQQGLGTRYVLTLTASIEFTTVADNKVIWSNSSMQFRDEFDLTSTTNATDAGAYLTSNTDAMERIAAEFARTVVAAILEAF